MRAFNDHYRPFGVVIWRLGMLRLPVFEECRLVTNVHRIADTIGDAWPLVAVDRSTRQALGEGATDV